MFDDWVPKKLAVDFQVPTQDSVDLERFRSATNGEPAEGEVKMPEAAEQDVEVEPELNKELLNMVI